MKSKEALKRKLINDPIFYFISNINEPLLDQINEVSISTFDKGISDIKNPVIVRGLWENGLNRKLTSIFVNLIKNIDTYTELNDKGYLTVDVDKQHNIIIYVTDFIMNDYNFEKSLMDNNTREYTFYYRIEDKSAEDNSLLITGRFDFDISVMYVDDENYKDITGEELEKEVGCELSYNIDNKIFFNKYITEEYYLNDDFESIMDKEVMILESIFADLDISLINSILEFKV